MAADGDELLPTPIAVEEGQTTSFGSSLASLERASAPLMGWAAEMRVAGLPWKIAAADTESPWLPGGKPQPGDGERLLAVVLVDTLIRGEEGRRVSDLARQEETRVAFARALCRLRSVKLPWADPRQLRASTFDIPAVWATEATRYAGWARRFAPARDVAQLLATAADDMDTVAESVDRLRWVAAGLRAEAVRQQEQLDGPVWRYRTWWANRHSPSAVRRRR